MKAFATDPNGQISPWDGRDLPPAGQVGWLSLRLSEKLAMLPLLNAAGLRQLVPFVERDWRHPEGVVAAQGVAIVLATVDASSQSVNGRYLFILLTPHFVVTAAPADYRPVERLEAKPQLALADGLDYLVFQLVTPLLDAYEKHSERLVARSEWLEQSVLHVRRRLYDEIFRARREALRLRSVIEPELDVLALLVDHRFPGETAHESPYLHDLVRRLRRIAKEVESVRDGLSAMVESYASVVANEMNRVMKFLTVLSTVFLPATLIASIYGMNFKIPEYHWPHGYAYSLGLMIVVSGTLIAYMAGKGWFR